MNESRVALPVHESGLAEPAAHQGSQGVHGTLAADSGAELMLSSANDEHQRRLAVTVLGVDVTSAAQEELDEVVEVVVAGVEGRVEERRVQVLVADLQVPEVGKQGQHLVELAEGDGCEEALLLLRQPIQAAAAALTGYANASGHRGAS